MLEPSRICIPGCGNGHEVVELVRLGFEVTAVDIADEPIEVLQNRLTEKNLKAKVVKSDLFEYSPDEKFDAVYEQTCLCAILRKDREAYESQISQWLKPNGKLFVLFAQSDPERTAPPFNCPLEEMRLLFSEARWEWPEDDTHFRVEHPSNRLHELAYVLKKR